MKERARETERGGDCGGEVEGKEGKERVKTRKRKNRRGRKRRGTKGEGGGLPREKAVRAGVWLSVHSLAG